MTGCYRHPDRETSVSCSDCDRPICTDCMVYGAVGIKCPECAKLPRTALVRLKPDKLARSIAAAVFGGLLVGVALAYLQGVGFFFALIFGYLVGLGMGELVLWASGRFRGSETARIALGGALWSYLSPYIFVAGLNLGAAAYSLARAPFAIIGAALAAYVAYKRVI